MKSYPNFKSKQKVSAQRVKQLRNNCTPEEALVRKYLLGKGIKHVFQKGFIKGNCFCIVDFYLPKPYKLCIEIDGPYHRTPEQRKKDSYKDYYLMKTRGFRVLRIVNGDVHNGSYTKKIENLLKAILCQRGIPTPERWE